MKDKMTNTRLYKQAFALLDQADAILLAARAKHEHEQVSEGLKKAA